MKRQPKSKVLALLMALLLAFQLLPMGVARADTPGRDSDITAYVYTHDTSGGSKDPAAEDWWTALNKKSSISISGGTWDENTKTWSEVPANATIDLWIVFHLENQNDLEYLANDWFTLDLPAGLTFTNSSGDVVVGGETCGKWEIDTATNQLKIIFDLNIEHHKDNIWAEINIKGTFQYLEDAEEGAEITEIKFGNQTITIERKSKDEDPKPPVNSTIAKSNTYNPETNKITWTVTITPPAGLSEAEKVAYSYEGFTVSDTLTGAHTYVGDSFRVNSDSPSPSWTTNTNAFTYTFPASAKGPQTITYDTTPSFGSGQNNNFSNSVDLYKGPFHAVERAVGSTLGVAGFFGKTSAEPPIDDADGETYVKWTVTVTVPKTLGGEYTYNGARIVDTIPGGQLHTFVSSNDKYPVKITYPGGSETKVDGTTNGSVFLNGSVLTYNFQTGHPKTSKTEAQTYTLTYYTVYNKDVAGNNNSAVTFTNEAKFEWTPTGGGTGGWTGPGVIVNKPFVVSGGLVEKKALGGTTFNHEASIAAGNGDYIKWEITVNRNHIPMGKVYITDAVTTADGHEFVIGDAYPLTVTKTTPGNITTTDTYKTSGSGAESKGLGSLTLDHDYSGGFRFDFPDPGLENTSKDSYTVTFYTRMTATGLAAMYNNSSKTFNNTANLHGHTGVGPVSASKTYYLQMLNKSYVSYDYNTRLITWKLVVNRNRLPMEGAVVTDTLPAGVVLSPAGESAFKITEINGSTPGTTTLDAADIDFADTNDGFTLTFPGSAEAPNTKTYTITYTTHVENSALLAKVNTSPITFTNKSVLNVNSKPIITSNAPTDNITNITIQKNTVDYVPANKDDLIKWSVEINPARIELENASVTDTLIKEFGLELDTNSVYLYEAEVAVSNGKLSKIENTKKHITLVSADLTLGVDASGNSTFTVKLDAGKAAKAYILEFSTNITKENVTISNTIALTGSGSTPTASGGKTGVVVNNVFSSGGSGSSSLKIQKVDATTGEPLKGVEIQLLRPDRTSYKNMDDITKIDGTVTFNNIHNWGFYLKETQPLPGYLAPAELIGPVRPSDYSSGMYVIRNVRGEAPVQITKVGAGNIPLSGGAFVLTGHDVFGKEYKDSTAITAYADVNGVVSFGNLPMGTYEIEEKAAPEGHDKSSAKITVTISYVDATKTAVKVTYSGGEGANHDILVNEPILTEANAKVSFTKTDDQGNPIVEKAGIDGGTFTLTGTNDAGTIADIVKSVDAAGLVDFGKLTVGTYKITETSAPAGYLNLTSKDIFNVTVSYTDGNHNDLKVTMTPITPNEARYVADSKQFKNTPAVGDVTFTKKDSANDAIKINGGTFVIYGTSLGGQSVSIEAHAVNNVVTFKDVPVGDDYTIKETVPPSGYFLTNKTLTGIKVVYTDIHKTAVQNVDLTTDPNFILTNGLIPYVPGEGKATVTKVDADGKVLAGATFTLYDSNGKAVASMTTGADGLATFTKLKPYSSYTIKETAAPTGYDLSSEVLTVTTKDRSVLTFTMVNKKSEVKLGSASILKTDADGKKLPGATFTLYDGDGKAVATAVTGSDGLAVFKDLVPGNAYTVKETMAPIGYQLSSEVLTLNVTPGAALSFTVLNKRLDEAGKGDVRILKTDAEGAALGGATFTLYDAEGRAVASATSGSDGGVTFSGIPANASYTIKETAAPSGYLLSGEVLSIQLTAGQVATYTVVNRKSDVPGTTPVLGSLSIMKVNSAKAPLAGAEFTVYDADGKVYASTVTGAGGIARFTGLPLGRYAVVETRAPQGYRLFTGTHAVTLTETSPNLSFTLRNASDSEKPETAGWEEIDETPVPGGPGTPGSTPVTPNGNLPKTGEIPMSFYLLLVGLSLLGAGLVTALPRKKGRKHLDHSKKD